MTPKKTIPPEKTTDPFSCADLEIAECPYYLLTRASLAATASMKRRFSAAGIGSVRPAYLGSLMSLWREDGLKMIDLGRRAGLEPSTMTGLLDRMERDGLVERRPDPTDRRVLKIFLTPDGAAAREKVVQIVDETLSGVFSGIDADRIEAFKKMMHQVLTNLREEKDDEPSE